VTGARVTALVPVKEYLPEYLREAVGSLLAQTSARWRAVIVCEPGARAGLESDLADVAHVEGIALVESTGRKLAGALNTGMREATTDFTAILFGDDMWAPDAVEVLDRNIADHPEVDFFHSARRIVDDDGAPISGVHPPVADVTPEMFVEQAPVKHLLCWRRELALAIGGMDESLNSVGPDDFDFPWSMMDAQARFAAVPECLYVYRDHRSCPRLTTHLPQRTHMREMRRIMRKHGVPRAVIRRRVADARRSYLRQCLYSSRLDAWVKRALRRDPGRGWRESYH
jgi:glycosyltransferase involved in cell wall biosynthesis